MTQVLLQTKPAKVRRTKVTKHVVTWYDFAEAVATREALYTELEDAIEAVCPGKVVMHRVGGDLHLSGPSYAIKALETSTGFRSILKRKG